MVTVKPLRGADQIQRNYEGTWRSVASYLNKTLAETQSDTLRKRTLQFMESHTCEVCDGRRLNPHALKVTYAGLPIDAFNELPSTNSSHCSTNSSPRKTAPSICCSNRFFPHCGPHWSWAWRT